MSAFILSRNHIAALVEALYRYDVPTRLEPAHLGQILWDENINSVQYRYDGAPFVTLPGACPRDFPYMQHVASTELRHLIAVPVNAFLLARCYISQSCEHPEWEYSQAYQLVSALCVSIIEQSGMSEKAFRVEAERETTILDLV